MLKAYQKRGRLRLRVKFEVQDWHGGYRVLRGKNLVVQNISSIGRVWGIIEEMYRGAAGKVKKYKEDDNGIQSMGV